MPTKTIDPAIDLRKDFGEPNWLEARKEMTRRLHRVARAQSRITYSDLCDEMRETGLIDLEPRGPQLSWMLGQINVLEAQQGRPLISVVVIHKGGDNLPGSGFWEMAKLIGIPIGRTEEERLAFCSREMELCHSYWRNRF
jgi:hypothetical protein